MRKKVSKLLATTLAAALMMTAVPAGATETSLPDELGLTEGSAKQTITGDVDGTVVEVTLPGNVSFTINPGLKSLNSKLEDRPAAAILGGDYNIINGGQTPVKVVVKPFIESSTVKVHSGSWPAINRSGTAYETDLELTSGAKNTDPTVKIAAILADCPKDKDIGDTDGTYLFSYTGTSGTLGRQMYSYTNDGELESKVFTALSSGSKLNSGSYGVITLKSGSEATAKLNSGADVFTLKLVPNISTADGKVTAGSVSSFTLVGLTNTHANHDSYGEEAVKVGVIYDVSILSVAEEKNNAILESGSGQGAIFWSGTGNGF